MEHRYIPMEKMETREDGDDLYIEGYFAVFNSIYELWPGATESIAPGAFDESVSDDVRALYNHNTDIVLGRTSAGTMEIRQDSHGLWGRVRLNRSDTDAMNAYAESHGATLPGVRLDSTLLPRRQTTGRMAPSTGQSPKFPLCMRFPPAPSRPIRILWYPPGSTTWRRSSASARKPGSTGRWRNCMVLSEAARKAAESILSRGERVELIPTKDGVRVFEIKRREIKEPASKR